MAGFSRWALVALGVGAIASGLIFGGCAQVPATKEAAREVQLVFPPPPDAPRFFHERTIYGSADVAVSKDAELKRILTGEAAVGEGLVKPYGIATHKGRVFVSDLGGVHLFDIPGKRYERIGDLNQLGKDNGGLSMPFGIDVDAAGNLYVVDGSAKAVMVYDPAGVYVRKFGGPNALQRPIGVAVEKASSRVYVVDAGGVDSQDHRIRVFDGKTGESLFDFGKRGTAPGEFNLPRDAAFGRDGMLYVVDGGNFRIQVFTRDGKFERTFGTVGRQTGQFARPKEIASDLDGNIYVIDAAFANFQIFDAKGQLLMFIGVRREVDGPASFMLPSGIAVGEDGRVYVVDQYYRKVEVFRPATTGATQARPAERK